MTAREHDVASSVSKINPATGLSTDYLNHFTEAIMVLEMAAMMPECLGDLRAWQPKTYREHFESSRFADRAELVAAYDGADPALREALDSVSWALNIALMETRDAMLAPHPPEDPAALAQRTLTRVKPLVARTVAIINGTDETAAGEMQAAIDTLFSK